MVWIHVEESDFAPIGRKTRFVSEQFKYTDTNAEKIIKVHANQIQSLNRQSVKAISTSNTNLFGNNFTGGTFFAIIMELLGFAAASSKMNRRIMVRFKDGAYLRGKTDIDTFFAVQNAYLDHKDNTETQE